MKRKTVYMWMGSIVVFTILTFTLITILNLQHSIKPVIASIDVGSSEIEFKFTIRGSVDNPLEKPMDVAIIGKYIYVSDTNNKQIQVFTKSGEPSFQFGEEGTDKGQFNFPYGISGDKDGNVYVADLYNGNISIFDSEGNFKKYFESEIEFQSPAGLRIFNDNLYITDVKLNKAFKFSLQGEKLLEIGEAGLGEGQFVAPNAITIDEENRIYVSDSGNNRVQVFDEEGSFIKIINGSTSGDGEAIFLNPRGVAVDSQNNIYIVNNMSHKLYVYDKDGQQIGEFGEMGFENDNFYYPNGLFIDDKNQIYITDTANQRVSVFN